MSNGLLDSVTQFWNNLAYCILGLLVLIVFCICAIFSLPIYLYRWIVCEVLAPSFRNDPGEAVTATSSFFATELLQDSSRTRPRYALVSSAAFRGTVTLGAFRDAVCSTLITPETSRGGGLRYPELQQYADWWMGYLFWTQDKEFNVDNHLVEHKCEGGWTEGECEGFACSLIENLLNKPFPKARSPWEVHLINGYKNSELLHGGEEMTLVVYRIHHGLADGFALMALFCEGVLGIPLSECSLATPTKALSPANRGNKPNFIITLFNLVSFPIKVVRDLGYTISMLSIPIPTPWLIPEEERTWRQLYHRSGIVPISKIKFVKDNLGVSFTAVLLSTIGAGIASSFKSKGFGNSIAKLPFGSSAPLKGHPGKLRNHMTFIVFEVPIDQTLSPLQRLKESEKEFQKAKGSTFPMIFPFLLRVLASHMPFVSSKLLKNRTFSTGLSNFPGSGVQLKAANGWDVISKNFATGLTSGVGGAGFMVLSYCDHITIAAVAENAAMDRTEFAVLIEAVNEEIDKLYELAKEAC